MIKYISLCEAVQRPENYLSQIIKIIIENKDRIQKATLKKDIEHIFILLSSILRKYKIKFRYKDDIGDYLGLSGESGTLPDMYNTIQININDGIFLIEGNKEFDIFIYGLEQTLGHEIIHRMQMLDKVSIDIQKELGKKANSSEKNYRFSRQELMAYAWSIIEDFRFMGYSNSKILEIIKKIDNVGYRDNIKIPITYNYYLGFFGQYNNNELRNQLHKYIYEYLND